MASIGEQGWGAVQAESHTMEVVIAILTETSLS